MPDELLMNGADTASLVMQGIDPSEFQVPKFRLAAEYVLAQVLVGENQGLQTGLLYVEGQ